MRLIDALARRFVRPSETLDGYEHPELVEVVFQKTMAYSSRGDWPEMNGVSSVLDFGGGCGLHYKQARSSVIRWATVETPAMVERAKELATERLQFFTSILDAAAWLGDIDVMHSNGALQYTPDPEQALRQLCGLRAKQMLWSRLLFGAPGREFQSSLLGDNGPGELRVREKIVRYERTRISEHAFLEAHAEYRITARGLDWFQMILK